MNKLRETMSLLRQARQQFDWSDLRWSHITILIIIGVGVVINLALPNGWTVWPFVFVFSLLTTLNEVADNNGQGVPPLQVYAFIIGAIVFYAIGVMILSKVNLFIQLLGLGTLAGYTYHGYMKYRAHLKLISDRRDAGLCVHCGTPDDGSFTYCVNCGHEPDPERAQQQRMTWIAQHGRKDDHARKVLKQDSFANIAAKKEKALLARSPLRRGRGKR